MLTNISADEAQRNEWDINVGLIFSMRKQDLCRHFDSFKKEIAKTSHLKTVFTDEWLSELKELIDNDRKEKPSFTETHTFFIAYCNELWQDNNFVQELDHYYGVISDKIKTHRIKSFKDKLGRPASRNYSNYLGTVYEIIVVGKFAEKGHLKEYEPILDGRKKYRPEAKVDISGQEILIEATVRVSNRGSSLTSSFKVGPGSREAIHQLYKKIKEKIDKFENINVPAILFVNVELLDVFPIEGNREVINLVNTESAFAYTSAVVISNFYNRLDGSRIYINRTCKNPLNRKSIVEIKEIFKLTDT